MAKRLILSLFFSIFCCSLWAQRNGLYQLSTEYQEDPYDELTYFFGGANYLSNNVYMGRKDSARLPYLSAYAGYQLAMGLYIRGTACYGLTKKSGHFDLFDLELGYDRNFGRHLLTGASVNKLFYYKNSPGVRSAITESANIYGRYENEKLEPEVDLTINKSNNTDVIWTISIDKKVRLLDNTINLFPAIAFSYGTLNYYSGYYTRKLAKYYPNLNPDVVMADAANARPLVVEISSKSTWRVSSWLFSLYPVWAIPLSPGSVQLPATKIVEKLKSSVYLELDVQLRHENK